MRSHLLCTRYMDALCIIQIERHFSGTFPFYRVCAVLFHSVSRFFVMLGSSASAFSAVHINSGLRFIKASKNICRLRSHPQNFAKPTWRLRRARDCATDCSKILPWITRKRSTTNIFDSGNYKSLPIKWIYRLVSGFALEERSSWSLWLGWSLKGGNMLVPRQKVGYTGLWCLFLVSFFFYLVNRKYSLHMVHCYKLGVLSNKYK